MNLHERLATALPFSTGELDALIATAQFRYKVYKIPKRKPGQFRIIAQPTAEIKLIQRWLVSNTLKHLPIHSAATAYRKGVSIASHAEIHARHRFLLKMDFRDFFPSISAIDLAQYLIERGGFSTDEARLICRLVCWRDRNSGRLCLSIGAPSSPYLSNAILYEFDVHASQMVRNYRTVYSRYADDLAFSTNSRDTLLSVKSEVDSLVDRLSYPRLTINEAKTISVSRAMKRTLVGLVLTPVGKVSLGRERKKWLRAYLFRFTKGQVVGKDVASLRGELAFAWSIEPEYVLSLVRIYGRNAFVALDLPFGSS